VRGISLGCSLSPPLGAFYLLPPDAQMQQLDVFSARFMDDWVVLAPTRWKLREAIRRANQVLSGLTEGSTFLGIGLGRWACSWPPKPSRGLSSVLPGFKSKMRPTAASRSTFGIG
jgi:hypothetical protein